jgi:dephospho-CoA kinase
MYVVGLTGGIGSGKSTVSGLFKKLGTEIIDADLAARKVVEKGSSALPQITDYFGKDSLLEDGTLNRAYLRSQIFKHQEKRQWLESLLHPLIRMWIEQSLSKALSPYVIFESPLLLETSQHQLTDRILVVDIPENLQLLRATQRDGNNTEQIQAIIDTQISRKERLKWADDIIDNSETANIDNDCNHSSKLAAQVKELHQSYLTLAANKKLTP